MQLGSTLYTGQWCSAEEYQRLLNENQRLRAAALEVLNVGVIDDGKLGNALKRLNTALQSCLP